MRQEADLREEHVHNHPILTRPQGEPDRHWKDVDGVAVDEIVPSRRAAAEPIAAGKRVPAQERLNLEIDANAGAIDRLRAEVGSWREGGWIGTTHATRELLEYWARELDEGPVFSLFFAQREAVETVICLTEVASESHWMVRDLKAVARAWSQGLLRIALRMATGTGKTTVMACLIAWYAVNRRREHRADARGLAMNVDRVVVVCPGRTIRDRLLGLNPRAKHNIYDEWRLVPRRLRPSLGGFPVTILNWEKLQPRKGVSFSALEVKSRGNNLSRSKVLQLVGGSEGGGDVESLGAMWSRLIGPPGPKRPERVVVLNDEGHHCWQRKEGEKPGVWMEALHGLRKHEHFRLTQAIDLSATPIFINPAKTHTPVETEPVRESALVPWIVSEFALMESMEAGLIKIPQPPRGDNTGRESALLNLFDANEGRKLTSTDAMSLVRQGAEILYADYQETFRNWSARNDPRIGHPVLIAVANNKVNARAIFEMLGGAKRPDGILEKTDFNLLSNVPRTGALDEECSMRTILVLSKTNNPETAEAEQIAGGALGLREVGSNATEDELREVLQTVARPGTAGEDVRCVVSVGMLTEGWDCQRVTHILGYRKFGSQLLSEQTMGRALRRQDYENLESVRHRGSGDVERRYPAEYATVFGVPFGRQLGVDPPPPPPPPPPEPKTEVHPVNDRVEAFRIWVPDFASYTMNSPGLDVRLDPERVIDVYPVDGQEGKREIRWVRTAGPIGKIRILERSVEKRPGEGAWQLAAELVRLIGEREEERGEDAMEGRLRRGVLFGACLQVVYEWLAHDKIAVLETDLGGVGMRDLARSAILDALLVSGKPAQRVGIPNDDNREHRSAGDWRPFLTGLKNIVTVQKSELNVAACHSGLEVDIARTLDASDHVAAFVRNHGPERIEIPYKYKGGWAKYVPDFFVRCHAARGVTPHVLLEGKGRPDERSEHKKWWTENWWLPCANAAGEELGQEWTSFEIGSAADAEQVVGMAVGGEEGS